MRDRVPFPLDINAAARRDIAEILLHSLEQFGDLAEFRYDALIKQALRDLAANPERPGSSARPEFATDMRSYPLSLSRTHVSGGRVRRPRHFIVYRIRQERVEVLRILHDGRDLARHLPSNT